MIDLDYEKLIPKIVRVLDNCQNYDGVISELCRSLDDSCLSKEEVREVLFVASALDDNVKSKLTVISLKHIHQVFINQSRIPPEYM